MTTEPAKGEISATSSTTKAMASAPPRLLRLPEVISRVGLRRSAIYQRMSEGRFPKCRTLGAKCSVWVETEINAWIESIASKSDDKNG
jgi:prophage regulatory protein